MNQQKWISIYSYLYLFIYFIIFDITYKDSKGNLKEIWITNKRKN